MQLRQLLWDAEVVNTWCPRGSHSAPARDKLDPQLISSFDTLAKNCFSCSAVLAALVGGVGWEGEG